MKLSKLKRDVKAAEAGVWITGAYGDLDILIASTDNRKYVEMLRTLIKPYSRNKAYMNMADDVFEKEIQNKALAKHVLLGWKNLQDDEGQDIPYSEQTAYDLLCDPENLEFRKIIIGLAEESEVFRKEVLEEVADKS